MYDVKGSSALFLFFLSLGISSGLLIYCCADVLGNRHFCLLGRSVQSRFLLSGNLKVDLDVPPWRLLEDVHGGIVSEARTCRCRFGPHSAFFRPPLPPAGDAGGARGNLPVPFASADRPVCSRLDVQLSKDVAVWAWCSGGGNRLSGDVATFTNHGTLSFQSVSMPY